MSTMAASATNTPDVTWRDALTPLSRASRRRWTACYALLLVLLALSVFVDAFAVGRGSDEQIPLILLVGVPIVFGMLRRGTRRIAALDHPDLDERDVAARNGAYRIAFPLLVLVVVAGARPRRGRRARRSSARRPSTGRVCARRLVRRPGRAHRRRALDRAVGGLPADRRAGVARARRARARAGRGEPERAAARRGARHGACGRRRDQPRRRSATPACCRSSPPSRCSAGSAGGRPGSR